MNWVASPHARVLHPSATAPCACGRFVFVGSRRPVERRTPEPGVPDRPVDAAHTQYDSSRTSRDAPRVSCVGESVPCHVVFVAVSSLAYVIGVFFSGRTRRTGRGASTTSEAPTDGDTQHLDKPTMGGRWSRAVPDRSLVARSVPSAFPPSPIVPPRSPAGGAKAPATPEIERNRALTDMLNKSKILTTNQATGGIRPAVPQPSTVPQPSATGEELPSGISAESLVQLLALHARQPEKWDAGSLAKKYGVANETALAHALKYVRTYRVEEDDSGKMRAIALEAGDPAPGDAEARRR